MCNIENDVRKVLHKRLEAIAKHNARKVEFFKTKKRMIQEIEEARSIWKRTMKLFPKHEF